MLAVAFAVQRPEYHSASAETSLSVSSTPVRHYIILKSLSFFPRRSAGRRGLLSVQALYKQASRLIGALKCQIGGDVPDIEAQTARPSAALNFTAPDRACSLVQSTDSAMPANISRPSIMS